MYQVIFKNSAAKELSKISGKVSKRIHEAVDSLAYNPRPAGSKKLQDSKENLYRIRIGDYRVIYLIDDTIQIVNVRKVGHRRDIYR